MVGEKRVQQKQSPSPETPTTHHHPTSLQIFQSLQKLKYNFGPRPNLQLMAVMSCCHVCLVFYSFYARLDIVVQIILCDTCKSAQVLCIRGIILSQLMAKPLSRNQTCENW